MAIQYQNPPAIDAILESVAVTSAGGPPFTVREGVFIGSSDGSDNKALVTSRSELQVSETGSILATSPAKTEVDTSSLLLLDENLSRLECIIVNTGTTVIYLAFGANPTTISYHIALNACSVANDGTGGAYITDVWKGQIKAISSALGGTICVTELT